MDDLVTHTPKINAAMGMQSFNLIRNSFIWVIAAIATAVAIRELNGLMADDGFIYWRVARNFVEHGEFTFNLGSDSEVGVTSIGYTLFLSLGWFLHGNMWHATIGIYVGAMATSAILCHKIGKFIGHAWSGVAAAMALIFSPWMLSTRGLESSLVVLVLTLMLYLYLAQRFGLLGLIMGMTPLVRMDAALLAVLLLGLMLVRPRRTTLKRTLAFGAVSGASSLILTKLLTGRFLPNTMSAKMAQGRSGFWGEGFQYAKGIWKMPETFNFNWWFYSLILLSFLGLGYLIVETFKYRDVLIIVALFGLGHYVVYGFVLRTPAYHWYYIPEIWALVLLGGFGLSRILETALDRRDGLHAAVALALGVSLFLFGVGHIPSGYSYKGYDEAGDWIRRNTPKTASVAAAEIGVIGWSSQRRIVDFLGLLDRQSVEDIEKRDLKSWMHRTKPDYFVTHEPRWHFEVVMDEPWFASAYTMVFKSSTGVNVFGRTGVVPDSSTP